MLSLNHVSLTVSQKPLLHKVSLDIPAGAVFGLLGANGAGKSTLLKAMSGEVSVTGEVSLYGKPLKQWPRRALAQHLAVLPQASQLTFPFSAHEVVALGLTPLSVSKAQGQALIHEVMLHTDTLQFADRAYPSLSGGERQRVQLARVLLQLSQAEQPPFLLLDEPTSAQDLGHQHGLLALAKDLAHQKGVGVVVILHDLNHALSYCDDCCVLANGHVDAQGVPSDVLTHERVEALWNYSPTRVPLDDERWVLV